jgi:predicted RNA-binding protein YlxR (DUF448 family)
MIEPSLSGHENRPQRTCLGCAGRDDQKSLIRIIIGEGGNLAVDPRGSGRGGYLHRRHDCWQAFLRRKNTHRAFRVNLGKDAKQRLIQLLNDHYQE